MTSRLHASPPSRNDYLSPLISSVRDEPSQPTNGDATPITTPEDLGATIYALQSDVSMVAEGITEDAVQTTISASPDKVHQAKDLSSSRLLGLRLLDSAMSRADCISETVLFDRSPLTPPLKSGLPPSSLSIKEMVKLKMLPLDFAVDAAKLAMGQGAEDDSYLCDAPTSEKDGVVDMSVEMDLNRMGDGEIGTPLDGEIS